MGIFKEATGQKPLEVDEEVEETDETDSQVNEIFFLPRNIFVYLFYLKFLTCLEKKKKGKMLRVLFKQKFLFYFEKF